MNEDIPKYRPKTKLIFDKGYSNVFVFEGNPLITYLALNSVFGGIAYFSISKLIDFHNRSYIGLASYSLLAYIFTKNFLKITRLMDSTI